MIWGIAYINKTYVSHIERDLERNNYYNIGFAIPQIRIVEKRFKGKAHFREVPLLFNYGFFQLTLEESSNREYLEEIRKKVNGIYSWIYASTDTIKEKTKRFKKLDKEKYLLNHPDDEALLEYHPHKPLIPKIEVVKEEVVDYFMTLAEKCSVFSDNDIKNCKPGTLVTLQGYPFEGLNAEVLSVDEKREKVKVKILLADTLFREVTVDFENVFYTIYKDFEEEGLNYVPIETIYNKNHERQSMETAND